MGPQFDAASFDTVVARNNAELQDAGCALQTVRDDRALLPARREAIASGAVVGWFQGRMEWGPRALGKPGASRDAGAGPLPSETFLTRCATAPSGPRKPWEALDHLVDGHATPNATLTPAPGGSIAVRRPVDPQLE